MWPLMFGLFVISEPFVNVVLTPSWSACIPYLRVFCIIYGFYPIHTANLNAIKALGRSDLFLKLEIIKKIMGMVFLLCSIPFGVMTMTYSLLVTTLLSTFINSFPNKTLMSYTYYEQIRDMCPSFLLSLAMCFIIYPIKFFISNDILLILIQIFTGALIYIIFSILCKLDSFNYIYAFIKSRINLKK